MVNVFVTSVLCFMCADIVLAVLTVTVGTVCQICLSRMYASDPLFHKVLLKRLRYQNYYLAQAPYFARKSEKNQ